MASLYNIAVALNLERLYNKTSDLCIEFDYEKGCQIFTDFDKCTFYNVHVITGAVDYGGFYGECDYGGCVSVRVWARVWVRVWPMG